LARSKGKIELSPYDDLFETDQSREVFTQERVANIDLDMIDSFKNHPFKIRQDQSMLQTVESVKQYGVLVPAIIRLKENGRYEMVAGHRRREASQLAEKMQMPCLIRNLTDDEATIIMVDSNLQREEILPSEKAFAYKMRYDAMKRQGQRTDLTCPPVVEKLKGKEALTASKIGKETGESHEQIRRYIRLTELIPEILEQVDTKQIAFRPAVELSYLTEEQQYSLLESMSYSDATPSLAQAIKMKQFSQNGKLTDEVIRSIMEEEKPNQREKPPFQDERITKLIPKTIPKGKESDFVVKALEHYNRHLERNKSRER
jgi:ParB family chromosome partitioning protein